MNIGPSTKQLHIRVHASEMSQSGVKSRFPYVPNLEAVTGFR